MSKIKVVVVVGLLVACIACGAVVMAIPQLGIHQFVGSNPKSARKIAASMVDYTLPTGYLEHGGRDIGVIKMAVITPDGQDPQFLSKNVLVLTTFPSVFGLSEDQFRRELQLALLRSANDVSTMEFVSEETAMLRGEEITLEVFESFGAHDPPTRILFSPLFPGKSDQVMLIFAGPISSWDQILINQLLESIR